MDGKRPLLARFGDALLRGIVSFFEFTDNILEFIFSRYYKVWQKMDQPAVDLAQWIGKNISFAWILGFVAGFPIAVIFLVFWSFLNFITAGFLGLFVAVSIPYFLGLAWYWYIIISLPLYVILTALIMFTHIVHEIEHVYHPDIRRATLGILFDDDLGFFWLCSSGFHMVVFLAFAIFNPPSVGLPEYPKSELEPIQIEITIREVQETASEEDDAR